MVWGLKSVVPEENKNFTRRFDCDDVGKVKEYVGCKIEMDVNSRSMKLVQPVMLQRFSDEFETSINCNPRTPAEAGTVFLPGDNKSKVEQAMHTYFRKGLGKLLHMTRWSRPGVQNSVQELSRKGCAPTERI